MLYSWWRLREAQASQLLTNSFRMQIHRRKYSRARLGTVRLQAQFRGRAVRKEVAATKIQANRRMYVNRKAFTQLKSAIIALQCCQRRGAAKLVLDQFKKDQKNVGKLKDHNEKLKMEMASLRAMLQAQAASDAGKAESEKAIKEKQDEIDLLKARIAEVESDLAAEKENVKKLENDLNVQKQNYQQLERDLQFQKERALQAPSSPTPGFQRKGSGGHERKPSSGTSQAAPPSPVTVGATVTPEALAAHRAEVARLEEQLEEERRMMRMARTEIKNLRAVAAKGGIASDGTASTAIISDNISEISGSELDRSEIPDPNEVDSQIR